MTSFKEHLNRLFGGARTSVFVTNVTAIFLLLVLAGLTWFTQQKPSLYETGINALILVIGFLVGWALAVFWVPLDEVEKVVNASIGAAVTAFVSGYAVSKFDRLLEAAIYPDGKADLTIIAGIGPQVGLFLAALLLAVIAIVMNRVDWLSNERKLEQEQKAKEAERKTKEEGRTAKDTTQVIAAKAEPVAVSIPVSN